MTQSIHVSSTRLARSSSTTARVITNTATARPAHAATWRTVRADRAPVPALVVAIEVELSVRITPPPDTMAHRLLSFYTRHGSDVRALEFRHMGLAPN